MFEVYTDGGVIGKNPSLEGGTWAFVLLDEERKIRDKGSGVLTPEDIGYHHVTNNVTELYALLSGVLAIPSGSAAIIHSDSQCSLFRMFNKNPKMNNVPDWVHEETLRARKHLTTLESYRYVLLDGHPTPEQLASGRGKRGNPVSIWNVKCDERCTRLSKEWRVRGNERGREKEECGFQAGG